MGTGTSATTKVHLEAGEHGWKLDLAPSHGGPGVEADPVTAFLGALSGCMLMSIQIMASAGQVTYEDATVEVRCPNHGIVRTIETIVTIRTDEPEEVIQDLMARAERGCYVKGLLREGVTYSTELLIERS